MPTVTVVDRTGQPHGTLELAPAVFGAPVNRALLHQAVVRELAGRRAGTHATRGRSEVSGGGKKPWRQKGSGRARQGSIRATQWKGGGKPFGPRPRRYGQAMPRQARRAALCGALSDKLAGGQLTVVEELQLAPPGKTKDVVKLLAGLGIPTGRSTLLVMAEQTTGVRRATRNLGWLELVGPGGVTVGALLRHERIVFERPALVSVAEGLGHE